MRAVLADQASTPALLLVTMAAEPRASFYGREIGRLAREVGKPLIVTWAGPLSLASLGHADARCSSMCRCSSRRAARSRLSRRWNDFGAFQRPPETRGGSMSGGNVVKALDEFEAKRLLASYGMPVVGEARAQDAERSIGRGKPHRISGGAQGLGAQFAHKTELGLVHLNLRDEAATRNACFELLAAMKGEGELLVQQMVSGKREFLVGMSRDPQFGPSSPSASAVSLRRRWPTWRCARAGATRGCARHARRDPCRGAARTCSRHARGGPRGARAHAHGACRAWRSNAKTSTPWTSTRWSSAAASRSPWMRS